MSEKVIDASQARVSRRKSITLVLLLLWVAAIFTYSILKFAKVLS